LAALFALASLGQHSLHYLWQNYLRKPRIIPHHIADYENFTKNFTAGCDQGFAALARPAHRTRLFFFEPNCCIPLAWLSANGYYICMRFALTKYGWPQVVIFPVIVLAAMAVCLVAGGVYLPNWAVILAEVILAIILIWVLSFFRDPYRVSPVDERLLLAPADGRITDIETVKENGFISGPIHKIGIFLSIFDAHINCAPCSVTVEKITYKPGKYKNAAKVCSGRVNESNELNLRRTDHPRDRLIVRQISGAIARRIVCCAQEGQKLSGGEKFGMIKFGSRTELYVVRVGDKVKAGLTPVIRYEKRDTDNGKIQN
jgi:phosphatidylserine decarboxylase precursor-related protein